MAQLFYNFCFPDGNNGFENYGFYYLSQQEGSIYSHTEFQTPDGPYCNIFRLNIKQDKVLAYKHNEGAWRALEEHYYPTSAYPLVLPKVTDEAFHYLSVSEDSGEVIGEVVLTRDGNRIIETLHDKVTRTFTMGQASEGHLKADLYVPKSIDWGGPVSFLCSDAIEAVKGTSFVIDDAILQQ